MQAFLNFIKQKGKPLSKINPGSSEFALSEEHALQAIGLLKGTGSLIVGGDILSENSQGIMYAYQLWGAKYIYLNWHYDKTEIADADESYEFAKRAINEAKKVAQELGKSFYIVLVIKH